MLKTDRINYTRLAQAQAFYKGRGYQNIETPWLVSPPAVRATVPIPKPIMETVRGVLVNSGEQGFIQQMMDGELTPGLYQTLTPCFQDDGKGGAEYFEQIELLCYNPSDVRVAYEQMLNDAMACFFEISDVETFDARQSEDGVEICFNDVLIGMYGIRAMGDTHKWVYGTGLVEPRFTLAVHSAYHTHEIAPAASNEQPEASEKTPPTLEELEAILKEDDKPVEVLGNGKVVPIVPLNAPLKPVTNSSSGLYSD